MKTHAVSHTRPLQKSRRRAVGRCLGNRDVDRPQLGIERGLAADYFIQPSADGGIGQRFFGKTPAFALQFVALACEGVPTLF